MKKSVLYVLVGSLVIGLLTAWMVGAVAPNDVQKEKISIPDSWVSCTPSSVSVIYDQGSSSRVHVLCTDSYSGIRYFALPLSAAVSSTTFESVASAAKANGKKLKIRYNKYDTSGNAWGCSASNCRKVKEVQI